MNQPWFPRLVERRAGGDSADERAADRAAAIIRGSLVPRDPHPSELARISQAIASPRRGHVRMAFRLALVLVCMVVGAATVKAFEMVRRAGWLGGTSPATKPSPKLEAVAIPRRTTAPAPSTPTAPLDNSRPANGAEAKALGGQRVVPASSLAMTDGMTHGKTDGKIEGKIEGKSDGMTGEPRGARAAAPRLGPAPERAAAPFESRPVLQPAPLPFVAPSSAHAGASSPGIAEETREIDRAIAYLRRDRDAGAALAELDRYLDRYPNGILRREAHLVRIDALLVLGRTDEVLRALETTSFDRGLRSTELLVVRAELRAERDCRRAEQDFTAALGRGPDADLLGRILYGRGACRVKLQDLGAVDDLRRYLERFPNGAHAEWARRWLASRPTSAQDR